MLVLNLFKLVQWQTLLEQSCHVYGVAWHQLQNDVINQLNQLQNGASTIILMDSKQVANIFLQEYFKVMQYPREQRHGLINFYQNNSQMTYTGSTFIGLKDISEKIESFGFESIKYANMTSDVQEGPIAGSIIVFVSGYLCMDGADEFRFAQVFNICPNGSGGFYIHNDIFTVVV